MKAQTTLFYKPHRLRENSKELFKKYWYFRYLILMFLIGFSYYIVFHYIPMYGAIIAFKDYRFKAGILGSPWVGLDNFKQLFSMPSFKQVFFNTVILSFYNLIFGFPVPILLALLINEVKHLRYKKFVQTVTYLPHFLSWVILAGVFIQFFSPSTGPVNYILKLLGIKPIYFLADTNWFRTILVTTLMWKDAGWGTIVYIAGIAGISPDIYEAAVMDGAGRFRMMWNITLPSLAPIITIMFILSVGKLLNDHFDQVFNLYSPAVYSVGDVISTFNYRMGLVDMNYSMATALGLFKNVIALILIVLTNAVSKKINEYGIW